MNITVDDKFFNLFDLRMRNFAKHKLPILRWVFLFYEETFQRMFKDSFSATSIQRVTWYRPFQFVKTI